MQVVVQIVDAFQFQIGAIRGQTKSIDMPYTRKVSIPNWCD